MASVSCCIDAETLSGWISCWAVLPRFKDRNLGSLIYESCRDFDKVSNGIS